MDKEFGPVLKGFEHVKRFWDSSREMVIAKVLPGEFYVSKHVLRHVSMTQIQA